jgi:hypothetical protein
MLRIVSSLKKEGIAVHDPDDSTLEIAQHNGTAPDAVLGVLHRTVPDTMASVQGDIDPTISWPASA